MPSKNDLSSLKTVSKTVPILPTSTAQAPATKASTGRAGRPAKTQAAKRSHKITLSLTQEEGQIIAEKSGLAGDATFLYAHLKNTGIFD